MIQALSHSATKVHIGFHHNNPRSAEVDRGRDAGHDYVNTLLWPSLPCVHLYAGSKGARAQLDGERDGKIMSNTGFKLRQLRCLVCRMTMATRHRIWPSGPLSWPFC